MIMARSVARPNIRPTSSRELPNIQTGMYVNHLNANRDCAA